MTTNIMPYRPQVDFCTTQCFSVQYGDKNEPLKCWQKVLIVALGILLVGIGGLALSYYWRERLVQQLYVEDYKMQAQLAKTNPPAQLAKTDLPVKKAPVPTTIKGVMEQIEPISAFLTQIQPHLYTDAQRTRLFCFNSPKMIDQYMIARFLFNAIPPGVYYVVFAHTDRVAEQVTQDLYQWFVKLAGEDAPIDLIIIHYALQWQIISNPKTIKKPYFKPDRVCQILYQEKSADPKHWEAIYFCKDGDKVNHVMSNALTKFTQTWVDKSQDAANEKRRQAVSRILSVN